MTSSFARRAAGLLALALAGALAGCQSLQSSDSFLGVITPYRIEVVQGNVITSEQIALARPGLTRAQVRDVLGSPLLADPFHTDRWDYVFTIRRQGAAPAVTTPATTAATGSSTSSAATGTTADDARRPGPVLTGAGSRAAGHR